MSDGAGPVQPALSQANAATRVFIYGSCVTRDGVDQWPDYGLELAGYVARQSLISAMSPASPADFNSADIASPFQRRMADGDIRGDVVKKLIAGADNYDVILWDITDERLGVYGVPSGGYVSRVVDYTKGIYRGPDHLLGPIRPGTPEHRDLWMRSLEKFLAQLESAQIADRVILNALPWAARVEGAHPHDATTAGTELFNTVLEDYSAVVRAHGMKVAYTDPSQVFQAGEHQWGPAPFHYTRESYRASLDAIVAVL